MRSRLAFTGLIALILLAGYFAIRQQMGWRDDWEANCIHSGGRVIITRRGDSFCL
jgi:hypothetical protein